MPLLLTLNIFHTLFLLLLLLTSVSIVDFEQVNVGCLRNTSEISVYSQIYFFYKKVKVSFVSNRIRQNLEECDPSVNLPKHEVYDLYKFVPYFLMFLRFCSLKTNGVENCILHWFRFSVMLSIYF